MENEIQAESVQQEESSATAAAEQQETLQAATAPEETRQEETVQSETAPEENAQKNRPAPVEVTDEMVDSSKKILITMLDYLGLEGTVKAEKRTGKINLLIASDDAGRIIGRKGQNLESLQTLVNRMMQKGDAPCPKIYIDIDGYSSSSKRGRDRDRGERGDRDDRRSSRPPRHQSRQDYEDRGESRPRGGESDKDDQLRQQALDSAKEVRRWGEPVTLPQMNSHDRRIIHITLENEKDLVTESVGDGNFKSVVISLKKEAE